MGEKENKSPTTSLTPHPLPTPHPPSHPRRHPHIRPHPLQKLLPSPLPARQKAPLKFPTPHQPSEPQKTPHSCSTEKTPHGQNKNQEKKEVSNRIQPAPKLGLGPFRRIYAQNSLSYATHCLDGDGRTQGRGGVKIPPAGSFSAGNISPPQILHAAAAVIMPANPARFFFCLLGDFCIYCETDIGREG